MGRNRPCRGGEQGWREHSREEQITPATVDALTARLRATGVGVASIRRTLAILSSTMSAAVAWDRIDRNPILTARKPRPGPRRPVRAPSPAEVEAIPARMQQRDACLVSVLGYAGLRPAEALAPRWGDVGEESVLVQRALTDGAEKATKTGRHRTVRLLPSLRRDLLEWRLASGTPVTASWSFLAGTGHPGTTAATGAGAPGRSTRRAGRPGSTA